MIDVTRDGRLLTIAIDRQEKANSLTSSMLSDLAEAVEKEEGNALVAPLEEVQRYPVCARDAPRGGLPGPGFRRRLIHAFILARSAPEGWIGDRSSNATFRPCPRLRK